MKLNDWAIKYHVSIEALDALRELMIRTTPEVIIDDVGSAEQAVSHQLRIKASEAGCRLWRNNVGAGRLENGRFIRWGLCNDSPAINKVIKSADNIGIRPVRITNGMVGTVIGQFLSREVKRKGWKYAGTESEEAQLKWAMLINSMGGDATITTGEF